MSRLLPTFPRLICTALFQHVHTFQVEVVNATLVMQLSLSCSVLQDTENVRGRHFDYTLVLDSDPRVEAGSVFRMLEVRMLVCL